MDPGLYPSLCVFKGNVCIATHKDGNGNYFEMKHPFEGMICL